MKLVICTKFQVKRMNCVESRRGGLIDPPLPPRLHVTIFSRRLLGLSYPVWSEIGYKTWIFGSGLTAWRHTSTHCMGENPRCPPPQAFPQVASKMAKSCSKICKKMAQSCPFFPKVAQKLLKCCLPKDSLGVTHNVNIGC